MILRLMFYRFLRFIITFVNTHTIYELNAKRYRNGEENSAHRLYNRNNQENKVMNRFKDKYRIQSARASWHDYNSGAYFVTICTAEQVCYFGTISDGKMLPFR